MIASRTHFFDELGTMRRIWHALMRAVMLVGVAGCASTNPVYQSSYRYEPPVDSAGQICAEKCEQKKGVCQQACTADYQSCLTRIEPLVDLRYGEALKRYAAALDRYRRDLDMYHLQLSLSRRDPFWYGQGYRQPWLGPIYFPPVAPRTPSRDAELNLLKKEKCDVECGCQPSYDTCFLACGGKRVPEEKCIVNCPK